MAGNTNNQNVTLQTAGMIVVTVTLTVSVVLSFSKLSSSVDVLAASMTKLDKRLENYEGRQRLNDTRLTKVETKLNINTP